MFLSTRVEIASVNKFKHIYAARTPTCDYNGLMRKAF